MIHPKKSFHEQLSNLSGGKAPAAPAGQTAGKTPAAAAGQTTGKAPAAAVGQTTGKTPAAAPAKTASAAPGGLRAVVDRARLKQVLLALHVDPDKHVCLRAAPGCLTLVVTDGDMLVERHVPAGQVQPGQVWVNGKLLHSALERSRAETVALHQVETGLRLSEGKAEITLALVPAKNLPTPPSGGKLVEVSAVEFADMVESVLPAAQLGVGLYDDGTGVYAIGMDHAHLHRRNTRMQVALPYPLVIDSKQAKELVSLARLGGPLACGVLQGWFVAQSEAGRVARRMAPALPAWASVQAQPRPRRIFVDAEEFDAAAKRLARFERQVVYVRAEKGALILHADSDSGETCEERLDTEYEGEPFVVALDAGRLRTTAAEAMEVDYEVLALSVSDAPDDVTRDNLTMPRYRGEAVSIECGPFSALLAPKWLQVPAALDERQPAKSPPVAASPIAKRSPVAPPAGKSPPAAPPPIAERPPAAPPPAAKSPPAIDLRAELSRALARIAELEAENQTLRRDLTAAQAVQAEVAALRQRVRDLEEALGSAVHVIQQEPVAPTYKCLCGRVCRDQVHLDHHAETCLHLQKHGKQGHSLTCLCGTPCRDQGHLENHIGYYGAAQQTRPRAEPVPHLRSLPPVSAPATAMDTPTALRCLCGRDCRDEKHLNNHRKSCAFTKAHAAVSETQCCCGRACRSPAQLDSHIAYFGHGENTAKEHGAVRSVEDRVADLEIRVERLETGRQRLRAV